MRNACHRAQLHTLRLVKMPHAFGAFLRVDDIDMLPQRNGAIGALRLTDIAIDAFFCNHQGHGLFSSSNTKTAYYPRLITALRPLYPSYPVTRMGLFLFKRLAALLLTLLLASAVVFAVLEVLPGNAAQVMLGPDAAPEAVRALERQLGLNQPALLRYGHWLSGLLQGQMGTSHAYGSPVSHLITQRLALTLPLALLAMLLAGCLALAAGVFAAAQHRRVGDRLVMTVSQLGMAERVMRASTAACTTASAKAGSNRLLRARSQACGLLPQPSKPPAENQRKCIKTESSLCICRC